MLEDRPPEITLGDLDSAPSVIKPTLHDIAVSAEELRAAISRIGNENAQLKEENYKLREKVRTSEILDKLIEPCAGKAFNYMFWYSGFVALIIAMNGFGDFKIPLESDVLKFLVGSTAVTVIGLVGMVLTGVFVGARRK